MCCQPGGIHGAISRERPLAGVCERVFERVCVCIQSMAVHFPHKGTNYTTFQNFCLLWLALAGTSVGILAGESVRMLTGESMLEVGMSR